MTPQAWITLVLVLVSIVQALGIWERVIVARKQYKLDKEKFEYRKKLDEDNLNG